MKKNKTLAIAAIAAALTACSSDDNGTKAPKYINIDAGLAPVTKTTVAADGTMSFTSGDAISVYAWTGGATALPAAANGYVVCGSANTYDGTKWTAEPQMLWKDLVTPHFFLAVYPKRDITTAKDYTFDVTKQAESDIMVATNFGTGGNGITATETAIPLTFDHLMAKLQVNLLFRNQWGADGPSDVALSATAKTTATIDFLAKAMSATGTASAFALPALASPIDGYAASFESIIIPQAGFNTITIKVNGENDYVYTHPSDIQLQSGKTTIINLVVGRNEITLGNVSISGWTTGTTIGDDTPIEVTD